MPAADIVCRSSIERRRGTLSATEHEAYSATARQALARLAGRSVALVGLMGAGKSTVGRRLAATLALPFHDSDAEIESASRMTVAELFAAYGEPEFRALEARVVARLADGPQAVISTGGGAYMRAETRERLRTRAVTVWLRADLDILMDRVGRRPGRPLLQANDPTAVMRELMAARHPTYGLAEITVQSRDVRRETIVQEIVEAIDVLPDLVRSAR